MSVRLSLGWQCRVITLLSRTKHGKTYHFCHDYGYLLLEEVLIVSWQPYSAPSLEKIMAGVLFEAVRAHTLPAYF
ncbi:hypothetical protein POKO110462_22945 [Pontibacter korlensis]|uniref:Uncharacterized protein n=1 Tax=Pontibacter korlensis TaxID=400092 RepID=A0A0E3UZI7_9BACT|nr:hypothetical protein [Pontibacter korlensis]AKD05406.1 hypothetical protein PKOR_23175 [Pontibacter korlensis]